MAKNDQAGGYSAVLTQPAEVAVNICRAWTVQVAAAEMQTIYAALVWGLKAKA